jgi:exopolysaccharide biosynthesis protein
MYSPGWAKRNGAWRKKHPLLNSLRLIVLLALSVPLPAGAQLHWIKAADMNAHLPYSLNVYLTKDSLNGRPLRACYIIADPYDERVDYTAQVGNGKRYTPSEFYRMEGEPDPYIIVNGAWFSGETNRNLELVIRGGSLVAYNQTAIRTGGDSARLYHYVTPSAIGINGARKVDVGWIFTDSTKAYPLMMLKGPSDPNRSKGRSSNPSILAIHSENVSREIGARCMQWPMQTAIGGGPTLIKQGQVFITSREEHMLAGRENELVARTAMGRTRDNKLIILVIEGGHPGESTGATLDETARILKNLGCWEALNMSGGTSSCLLINGQPIIRPSDPSGSEAAVSSVLVIKSHL